jgi:hypothetical protein
MVPIPKPMFRPIYDHRRRNVLGISISRKTCSTTRLPLTSLHENRLFRFVFIFNERLDGGGFAPAKGNSGPNGA